MAGQLRTHSTLGAKTCNADHRTLCSAEISLVGVVDVTRIFVRLGLAGEGSQDRAIALDDKRYTQQKAKIPSVIVFVLFVKQVRRKRNSRS